MSCHHCDVPPFALVESQDAQCAARRMPGENREPDVDRIESAHSPDDETRAERNYNLRDDRDVEGTLRVACALKSTSVCECNRDEQSRQAQNPEQRYSDLDDVWFVHAKDSKKLSWQEQEEQSDERCARHPD